MSQPSPSCTRHRGGRRPAESQAASEQWWPGPGLPCISAHRWRAGWGRRVLGSSPPPQLGALLTCHVWCWGLVTESISGLKAEEAGGVGLSFPFRRPRQAGPQGLGASNLGRVLAKRGLSLAKAAGNVSAAWWHWPRLTAGSSSQGAGSPVKPSYSGGAEYLSATGWVISSPRHRLLLGASPTQEGKP